MLALTLELIRGFIVIAHFRIFFQIFLAITVRISLVKCSVYGRTYIIVDK